MQAEWSQQVHRWAWVALVPSCALSCSPLPHLHHPRPCPCPLAAHPGQPLDFLHPQHCFCHDHLCPVPLTWPLAAQPEDHLCPVPLTWPLAGQPEHPPVLLQPHLDHDQPCPWPSAAQPYCLHPHRHLEHDLCHPDSCTEWQQLPFY